MATATALLAAATTGAAVAAVTLVYCIPGPVQQQQQQQPPLPTTADNAETTTSILAALGAAYGTPGASALSKEVNRITAEYRRCIEYSPFMALATSGPRGLDCSPRGEDLKAGHGGLVRVIDEKTLLLPDRRGNNRCDSLRNIAHDPRVALLFLIPGSGNTIRVNGSARISFDPDLLSSFAVV